MLFTLSATPHHRFQFTNDIILARTLFFTKRERTWGCGLTPLRHLAPERDKASRQDQWITWNVPNPMVYDMTYLGQPLTFQVRSNKKVPF